MVREKIYATSNPPAPNRPVIFDADICNGCNTCVEACDADVFIPNPDKGKPPLILYPDECWYGGCCVAHCPMPGAIKFNLPLMQRVRWKRMTTGGHFRL